VGFAIHPELVAVERRDGEVHLFVEIVHQPVPELRVVDFLHVRAGILVVGELVELRIALCALDERRVIRTSRAGFGVFAADRFVDRRRPSLSGDEPAAGPVPAEIDRRRRGVAAERILGIQHHFSGQDLLERDVEGLIVVEESDRKPFGIRRAVRVVPLVGISTHVVFVPETFAHRKRGAVLCRPSVVDLPRGALVGATGGFPDETRPEHQRIRVGTSFVVPRVGVRLAAVLDAHLLSGSVRGGLIRIRIVDAELLVLPGRVFRSKILGPFHARRRVHQQ